MGKRRASVPVRVFGGLAGQLAGVSYALYLSDHLGVKPHLVFDSGGQTFRPLVVKPLLETQHIRSRGITWSVLEGPIGQRRKPFLTLIEEIRVGLFELGSHMKDITDENIVDCVSNGRVDGYLTDFRVIEKVVTDLELVIGETDFPNFLRPGFERDEIAVHWRLGDYLDNPFHGVLTVQSLLDGLECLVRNWRSKKIVIYTDSPDYLGPEILDQFSASIQVVSGSIWDDLFAMSASRWFLGSHSGISQWVAISKVHGGFSDSFVLPSKWFATASDSFQPHPTAAMKSRMLWEPVFAATPV